MTDRNIFTLRREYGEYGIVGSHNLRFLRYLKSAKEVARIARPVLFLFPVPELDAKNKATMDTFYSKAITSLAALHSKVYGFGIAYMITNVGTVNYLTFPDSNFGLNKAKEYVSTLGNTGFLKSLGIRGSGDALLGVDPFIAYPGDLTTGKVLVKGNPFDYRIGHKFSSWVSRKISKGYYEDSDIWPLYQPSPEDNFFSSILESAASVQSEIASGLDGRLHLVFNFRPLTMRIRKGVGEIEMALSTRNLQRKKGGYPPPNDTDRTLSKLVEKQFWTDRARNAYQVEVQIFAVYPEHESTGEWERFVDIIAEKGSKFYENGVPFDNNFAIPHPVFKKVEVPVSKKDFRDSTYFYVKREFFKAKQNKKGVSKMRPNGALSIQETVRMLDVPSQEMISDLRIIRDRGRVNTLPALEWLHKSVFGKEPDPETMVDGYGDRDNGEDPREE